MDAIEQELSLHLRAGYTLIFLETQEEDRAVALVQRVCTALGLSLARPREPLQHVAGTTLSSAQWQRGTVVLLDDLSRRLSQGDIARFLADIGAANGERGAMIAVGTAFDIPPELERLCALLSLPFPNKADLLTALREVCVETGVLFSEDDSAALVRAAQGMTLDEATRALRKAALGWPEDTASAVASVHEDKKRAIRRSAVLEATKVELGMDRVGGMDRLKDWLASRQDAFLDEARGFGLPAPRGLLLMGVQGCGKSLMAKAVAGYWKLPLVRLDLSAVFGTAHPEAALRGALRTAEAMAPCVLWIDEIEKGFSKDEAGVGARLLGSMVTWLQEKSAEVFVVATANRVAGLPPELPRKGRFDEIFFVDLPDIHERAAILELHLRLRGRDPKQFDLEELAKRSDKLTGSELEQVIIAGLYNAYAKARPLSGDDLLRAIRDTVPLYETYEEEIKNLREWARRRARPASTDRRRVDLFAPAP
ncbi:MAG: AAA family ATPase [Myxococcota bacterium]|jgi:SpoVK/Ycf46/Vps4 family AAA+-type ATPase|nr:AAA family ATPase [Myxococcota bacterium]